MSKWRLELIEDRLDEVEKRLDALESAPLAPAPNYHVEPVIKPGTPYWQNPITSVAQESEGHSEEAQAHYDKAAETVAEIHAYGQEEPVAVISQEDWDAGRNEALAEIGMTLEELNACAREGCSGFPSEQAKRIWFVYGD